MIEYLAFPDASLNYYLDNTSIVKVGSELSGATLNDQRHATAVASIIAGSQGIVPKAQLYAATMNDQDSLIKAVKDLIDNGVKIINISGGFPPLNGTYDETSRHIDYLSYVNNALIIKSAGNKNAVNQLRVTSPGMGYNVLTVGAISKKNTTGGVTLWPDSCYQHNSNIAQKPDILAPGVSIGAGNRVPGQDGKQYTMTGTSFAAPMVTGVAAAMLQKKMDTLNGNPHLFKAMMAASAHYWTGGNAIDANGFLRDKMGAGNVDCYLACTSMGYVRKSVGYNSTITSTTSVSYSSGTKFRVAACWEKESVDEKDPNPSAPMEIRIYQNGQLLCTMKPATNHNLCSSQFTTTTSGPLTFQITNTSSSLKSQVAVAYRLV